VGLCVNIVRPRRPVNQNKNQFAQTKKLNLYLVGTGTKEKRANISSHLPFSFRPLRFVEIFLFVRIKFYFALYSQFYFSNPSQTIDKTLSKVV